MAEKKVLEVRFVNFGVAACVCSAQVISRIDAADFPKGAPFAWHLHPQWIAQSFESTRSDTNAWIETLNSGDAPRIRIERRQGGGGYRLYTTNHQGQEHFFVSDEDFEDICSLLNVPKNQNPPAHTPKKYEPKWARILPREYHTTDFEFEGAETPDFLFGFDRAREQINQIQQTEAKGLEVWSLMVYEESA